jgi:hypothetical protein
VPIDRSRAHIEEVRSWVAERRLASTVLGGLLLTSLAFWGALLVTTGGDRSTPPVASSLPDEPTAASADEGARSRGLADEGLADESALSRGLEAPADEDPPEGAPGGEGQDGEPPGTVLVDLDGRCEVEIDAAERDDPRMQQAWRHPECVLAPLDPTRPDERWIVIVSSFTGEQAARQEAAARDGSSGQEPNLLWSSHYPSLRPDLWVVFEGPFRDRATAAATAEELGSGAYLRRLAAHPPRDDVPPGR